jgi:hypothetical protein
MVFRLIELGVGILTSSAATELVGIPGKRHFRRQSGDGTSLAEAAVATITVTAYQ